MIHWNSGNSCNSNDNSGRRTQQRDNYESYSVGDGGYDKNGRTAYHVGDSKGDDGRDSNGVTMY